MPRPASTSIVLALFAAALFACHEKPKSEAERAGPVASTEAAAGSSPLDATLRKRRLENTVAYIPPQCFTKTQDAAGGTAKNPCYVCHTDGPAPSFNADSNLQILLSLPGRARQNPWTNLFEPPLAKAPPWSDEDVLGYVRTSNYDVAAITRALASPPDEWDVDGDHSWSGYVPDAQMAFDDLGFDHAADGSPTGWRAFGYAPFPGTFFPTNGSADDVLVRLDPRLQQDRDRRFDARVYEVNLAVVEALVTRAEVAIDPVDERALGLDLDLDGHLGRADHVAFDAAAADRETTRMRYAGLAGEEQRAGRFPIAPGLFPLGTEFFHTVRYLAVGPDGAVAMAPRMKEVRYAKKVSFLGYDALRGRAALDARERALSRDGSLHVNWLGERGVDNGQGWILQGFIEDAQGALRPQTREETTYCVGCHGGIGATTDSIFSFPRKLAGDGLPARGWFHWSQRDLRGLPEPKRADGRYEYALYLEQAGGGDELRENREVVARFFDDSHALRADEVARLHDDVSRLLLPSRERAIALDRAYRAVVVAQSFDHGRDAVLAPSANVYATAPVGQPTGIQTPVPFAPIARVARTSANRRAPAPLVASKK